uniref:VTT domain-containing protein n=1 Tax=Dunaliella tertiolecta TaxID=3047 RepID=A0A7S3R5T4_DUNTE|mmetsp:Transcript_19618/g.54676  ORF Transcript_19618/g.54676 Transcript_19618/m.54676 type:complete len:564 (-) Transcript_19618:315-2006(-)
MSRVWRPRRVVNGMPRQVPSSKGDPTSDRTSSFLRLLRGTEPSMAKVPASTKLFYALMASLLIGLFIWGQSVEPTSQGGKTSDAWANWGSLDAWQKFASAHPTGVAAACAISVLLLCPSALVQTLSGAVLGLGPGFLAAVSGTLAGQAVAFILGRYLARDALARWLAHNYPQFGNIEVALFQQDGIKLVFLMRLSPFLPDSVMNYALALTSISWQLFLASTLTATIPYTLLYAYLGSASSDILQILQGNHSANSSSYVHTILVCVGMASFVVLLVVLAVALRRAMARASQQQRQQHQQQLERTQLEGAEQQRLQRLGWREQQRRWAQQRQQDDAELGLGPSLQKHPGGLPSCGTRLDRGAGVWDATGAGAQGCKALGLGQSMSVLQQQGQQQAPRWPSIQQQQRQQHAVTSLACRMPTADSSWQDKGSSAEGGAWVHGGPGPQQYAVLPVAAGTQQGHEGPQGGGGMHQESDHCSHRGGAHSWGLQACCMQEAGHDPPWRPHQTHHHEHVVAQGLGKECGGTGGKCVLGSSDLAAESQSMRSLSLGDLRRTGVGVGLRALSAA